MRGFPGAGPVTEHVADAAATSCAEPSALTKLLERVEAATGDDPVIDLDLWCATADRHNLTITQAPFTSSLDAALALVERVLPGWGWCLRDNREGQPFGRGFFANVFPGEPNVDRVFYDALGPTPALAFLAAMLKALIASTPDTSTGNDRNRDEKDHTQEGRGS